MKESSVSILSTKKLSEKQKSSFVTAEIKLVDYNAIEIEYLDVNVNNLISNAIFTSQNGVKSILNKNLTLKNCFCVGKKTEALLIKNGQNVVKTAKNSLDLGQFIAKNYKNESFHYICGTERRNELPELLKTSKINFSEVKTYKTHLKSREFNQKWNGILFFSPSGVKSYFQGNRKGLLEINYKKTIAFCIGNTTAQEAKKFIKKIVVAKDTTVESVVEEALTIHK